MCGIAGFIDGSGGALAVEEGRRRIAAMTDAIAHRGPDADGHWVDDAGAGVYLGHRRLSIVDLSAAGAQPMISHCGRFVMVFNGEIYNYAAVTAALRQAGHDIAFKGHSDTEVLLEGFARLGRDAVLRLIKGMFAIALWDRREKTLTLMRDHVGKKPLYYGFVGGDFVFASELKAVLAGRDARPPVCRTALAQYDFFGFVPEPLSIFEGIYKLPPAHYIVIPSDVSPHEFKNETNRFDDIFRHRGDDDRSLEDVLIAAVRGRMMADVPLGAFLSGGIDSSLVTALMQSVSDQPVKTYSIGFSGAFDESTHAEKVAAHLGTDHTTYHVGEADARAVIPQLARIYDEPFADYSQIPSVILCQKARQDTVVALSGDGGDEFFCGYKRYFMLKRMWDRLGGLPYPARIAMARALRLLSQGGYNALGQNGKRIHTVANLLAAKDLREAALKTLAVDTGGAVPAGLALDLPEGDFSDLERMMQLDARLYLPGDILVKVDRASMFASMEVRSPLLDIDVIAKAWSIPVTEKVFAGVGRGKKPLYDLLCGYVPAVLIDRPKQGFTPPVAEWMRGPMKEWAVEMLFADTGLYDGQDLRRMWDEFLSGKTDHHYALWRAIMVQGWYAEYSS